MGVLNINVVFSILNCFYFYFQNGSFLVNAKCTTKFICANGMLDVNEGYNCSTNAVCETRNDVHKCYCISGYQGDGEICNINTNCLDFFNDGITTNGIYTINPTNWSGSPFEVFCNMTEGGGWTVSCPSLSWMCSFSLQYITPVDSYETQVNT